MTIVDPPAAYRLKGIDAFPYAHQYHILRYRSKNHPISPREIEMQIAELRLFMDGGLAPRSIWDRYWRFQPPTGQNTLPPGLRDKPSLIDFDHWSDIYDGLKMQGKRLPGDYLFSGLPSPAESQETIQVQSGRTRNAKQAMISRREPVQHAIDEEMDIIHGSDPGEVESWARFGMNVCAVIGRMVFGDG